MSDKEKEEIRQRIKELIASSLLDVDGMAKNTQPIKPENSLGRISRMDAINNKSVAEAALRNKRKKLSKLRMALANIDKEDFGFCSACHNPIQQGRLIFMPESTECVRCASRR